MSLARVAALIRGVVPLALSVLAACERGANGEASGTAVGAHDAHPSATPAAASTIRTADRPADACGWISAAEVSTIVGPLTGSPHPSDAGCVYPLPLDSATAQQRAQMVELRRKLEARFGKSERPMPEPDESAVVVEVEVYTDPAMGRAMGAAMAHMFAWLPDDSTARVATDSAHPAPPTPAPPLPGWDWTNPTTHRSFVGRLGYVRVEVTAQAAQVTREQTVAVAQRLRERIPDLPFAYRSNSTGQPLSDRAAGPDPCSLLTAPEADAVLGKLVVQPYRSHESTPLADANGKSCSYATAAHHALVLTPTWEYGGRELETMRMVGGLVSRAAPELKADAVDTLEGWEDAGTDPTTGQLYFLTGERLLQISYLVSSTDANGAARLARIATGRLGKGTTPEPPAASEVAGRSSGCPSAAAVGTAVGVAVTVVRADDGSPDWMTCEYQLTGRYRGVEVELKTEPSARAETRFAEIKEEVRSVGANAVPDRIAVGEGGWAYGTSSQSRAAAVAGGHLYLARMNYFMFGSIGGQKDAMVRVLKLAIH